MDVLQKMNELDEFAKDGFVVDELDWMNLMY